MIQWITYFNIRFLYFEIDALKMLNVWDIVVRSEGLTFFENGLVVCDGLRVSQILENGFVVLFLLNVWNFYVEN